MYDSDNQYSNFNNFPYDSSARKAEDPYNTVSDRNAGNVAGAPEEPKKGSGLAKKLGTAAACALVFGAVAGVTMGTVSRAVAPKNSVASAESSAAAEVMPNLTKTATKEAAAGSTAGSSEGATLDVSAIVEKAMPSVVAIDVKGEQQVSDFFGRTASYETSGAGSGIIIGENEEEYLIVTNNHVIENTTSMKVQFIDGKSVDAELKGTDSGADVAVIAVKKSDVADETKSKIAIAEIGDSNELKVGQGVIAIGNALGYGQSVTVGYLSAKDRTITAQDGSTGQETKVENLLQTDAAINPGNSGGALLNMQGQVIGINESKSVDTKVEGMGYAIPISSVTELINQLSAQKTRGTVAEADRGYIGFRGQNVDNEAAQKFNMPVGIFVYKIIDGGAAAESELQENDIITKFEGQSVSSIEDLKEKLTRYKKGETVTLTVKRPSNKGYEEKEIQLTLKGQDSMKNATAESESKDGQDNKDSRDSGNERRNSRGDSGNRSDSNSGDNSNEDGSLFPFQW